MPKKEFEETPYDPIAADLMRDVVQRSKGGAPLMALAPDPPTPARQAHNVSEDVARIASAPAPMMTARDPVVGELTITKRFVLTRSENEELETFLLRLHKAAGVKVTLSMFTRAILNVAMQAEELLLVEVGGGVPRRFPSTHDSIAQGTFEEWWMCCLTNALRRLPRGASVLRSI